MADDRTDAMAAIWEVSKAELAQQDADVDSLRNAVEVVPLTRLLRREPFQMVTAIQQPGHCLWRVRKPLSPQAPSE